MRAPKVPVFRNKAGIILIACLLLFVSQLNRPAGANSDHVPLQGQAAVEKININTAPPEDLIRLKRVGPVIAGRIIEYREKHGPFQKPEDILEVKGIGPKMWEINRDVITVE